MIVFSFARFRSHCFAEKKNLPQEEKADPHLFASNVRKVCSGAEGLNQAVE